MRVHNAQLKRIRRRRQLEEAGWRYQAKKSRQIAFRRIAVQSLFPALDALQRLAYRAEYSQSNGHEAETLKALRVFLMSFHSAYELRMRMIAEAIQRRIGPYRLKEPR